MQAFLGSRNEWLEFMMSLDLAQYSQTMSQAHSRVDGKEGKLGFVLPSQTLSKLDLTLMVSQGGYKLC